MKSLIKSVIKSIHSLVAPRKSPKPETVNELVLRLQSTGERLILTDKTTGSKLVHIQRCPGSNAFDVITYDDKKCLPVIVGLMCEDAPIGWIEQKPDGGEWHAMSDNGLRMFLYRLQNHVANEIIGIPIG